MHSFDSISDDIDDSPYTNDEYCYNSIEKQKILEKDLSSGIYNELNPEMNNSIKVKSDSDDISNIYDNVVDEEYFDVIEDIIEVKISIYYILSLNCRLIIDSSTNYFEFLNKKKEVKLKRLIIQNFIRDKENIIYKDKKYIFIPSRNNVQEFTFFNNQEKITYYKETDTNNHDVNIMKLNGETLLNMNQFLEAFSDNPEIKNLLEKSELIKRDDEKTSKSKEEKNKINKNSKNSNESCIITTTDDSEKETNSERFYKINNVNDYTRFFFSDYEKDIGGIYNKHKTINLNVKEKIILEKGLANLKNEYNDNNDLKCGIIYKNFDKAIIDDTEPIIIEVKKGFQLIDLFNQIKQNSKIFNNFISTKKITTPQYAIGIICTDFMENYQQQLDYLNNPYKFDSKITYFQHITKVISKNNFKVVIGVFKSQKILDYPLNIEDWKIRGKNLSKRVDIRYMNEATGVNLGNKELVEIENLFKNKYKSLFYAKTITIGEHKNKILEIQEKFKEKIKGLEKFGKKSEEESNYIKEIIKELNKLEAEEIDEDEEENKDK